MQIRDAFRELSGGILGPQGFGGGPQALFVVRQARREEGNEGVYQVLTCSRQVAEVRAPWEFPHRLKSASTAGMGHRWVRRRCEVLLAIELHDLINASFLLSVMTVNAATRRRYG
jgi:hypothetical protein